MTDFHTILVANRGEIACRVLRTIRALGLGSVAVYSEADADAPHTRLADRALCIGPAPAAASYLDPDRLLEAAAKAGADAIHPGYGFLAESAAFARACEAAGLVFIGPSAAAIAAMGDKARAKRVMRAAGVACVPGYDDEGQSDDALERAAAKIGYPLMVKAAAGGGGRGLRRVETADELPATLALARSEARAACGDARLILERVVEPARHVEIQVLADARGQTIHLGERDCSIQRRHQKLIEEAPSPALTETLRGEMGATAVAAASAIGYRGAGTVEFLLAGDGRFYFLEMNTRLQVEHPVTECITGIDLVEQQIRIARGEALALTQDDVTLAGHAIEARLYTEDPARDFEPAVGRVSLWRPPEGPGLRTDAGLDDGQLIGPWYDALAAKIIAWGPTREIARRRLLAGLRSATLFGPATNKAFLIGCLEDPRFVAGEATTRFVADRSPSPLPAADEVARADAVAATVGFLLARNRAADAGPGIAPELLDWTSGLRLPAAPALSRDRRPVAASVLPLGAGRYRVTTGGRTFEMTADPQRFTDSRATAASELLVDGLRVPVRFQAAGEDLLWLAVAGREYAYRPLRPGGGAAESGDAAGRGRVCATMHGLVESVAVAVGDRVDAGQALLVMEAMKMQQQVRAPAAGTVAAVHVEPGAQVGTGAALVTLEPLD